MAPQAKNPRPGRARISGRVLVIRTAPGSVAALLLLVTMAGCGGHKSPQTGAGGRQLRASELSAAERQYGVAPVPDPSVTYQPDVVLVGGGAAAIRELDPNGFIWTIDGSAPRARELAPGKIFFMTGRAVGRVLDVRKSGADLVVTVGPADITEIIRDAHIHIESMPINFGEALTFKASTLGRVRPVARAGAVATPRLVSYREDPGWRFYRTQGAALGAPSPTRIYDEKNFKATPLVSANTLGIDVGVDDNGFKFKSQAVLHFLSPTLNLDLKITAGRVETVALALRGAAGLNWNFKMGSAETMKVGIKAVLQPDTDISIPIAAVAGVPLAITLRQQFLIETGLEVKNSTLSAQGGYTFNGAFKVGYVHNFWTAEAPSDYTTDQSMTRTGEGVSLGIQGLNLADQVKIIVGMGVGGFAAGPYMTFHSDVGAFRNSSIGMLQCNGATLVVNLTGGVGYVIPKAITQLINSVLSALNIKYRITGQGGLEGKPYKVIQKTSQLGGCKPLEKDPNETGTVKGGV